MIPGPTMVNSRVLRVLSKPTLSHVSPAFVDIFDEAIGNLKKIFMTKGDVLIICGSGTLAVEMAVANIVEPGDKVLVVINGLFGERFAEICARHKAAVTRLNVDWGKVVDPERISEELVKDDYEALFVVHVDTSTGATNKIREIGDITKHSDTLFVVDTVCSLGGMEVRVDDWNIDICAAGSQKAIAVPPGLALLAVSEKALKKCEGRSEPVDFYYGDFQNWIPVMKAPRKYFATPAVNMVYALDESLKMILTEGLENRFRRHEAIAKSFRAAVKSMGLDLVPDETVAANTLTVVRYPNGVNDADFRGVMAEEFKVIVAGGLGPLKGKCFRVGHMGNVSVTDITATIGAIEMTLQKLGYHVKPGTGLESAEEVFMENSNLI